jgi:hypothetical protein
MIMTYEQRRYLKSEVDRRRREMVDVLSPERYGAVERSIDHSLWRVFGYEPPKWREGNWMPQAFRIDPHRRRAGDT